MATNTKTIPYRVHLIISLLFAAILMVLPQTLNADHPVHAGMGPCNPYYQPQVTAIGPTFIRTYPHTWARRYYRFPVRHVLPWNRPALEVTEKRTGGLQFYQRIPVVEAVYPSPRNKQTTPETQTLAKNEISTTIQKAN